MGFILYPPSGFPKWNTDDHDQMMVVTVLFTMHLAIILMFEACLGAIIYRVNFYFLKIKVLKIQRPNWFGYFIEGIKGLPLADVLTEKFFQGNFPLGLLLNMEIKLMS